MEEQYKGYNIHILQDEYAQSPNEWGDCDMKLIYDHRDFYVQEKGFWNASEIFEHLYSYNILQYPDIRPNHSDKWHIFPVYAYIHSGIALSLTKDKYPFTDRWDVSFKGFALIRKVKQWSWKRDTAFNHAKELINEWNRYLSGEVFRYEILKDNEHIEGCGGHDSEKDALDEAKYAIDSFLSNEK